MLRYISPLSTTESGWKINFEDLVAVAMECRGGESDVSLEQVEDVILALHKLGHLELPNAPRSAGRIAPPLH